MTHDTKSSYWLDKAADEIVDRYPGGEIVVSSGISPSASYHIGHFREIMTADALTWAIRQRGRKSTHIHVVDNFDPLRKWYDFLPPADQDYAGWPVSLVPDPLNDGHASYADHFFEEFHKNWEAMGLNPKVVRSYEDLYQPGHMVTYIEQTLEHTPEIVAAYKDRFKRELPADWTPVLVLKDNKFEKGQLSTWDAKAKTINGISYEGGNAKLDWRLDWPARWAYLHVNVEPFGFQEHGAAGGSYDTGKVFAKEVFGIEAPYSEVQYGHIHRPGENVKMSSSKNNVVTPGQALEIMPAEVIRYFIVRSRPEKKIFFDSGTGLYNLLDEFAAAQDDSGHEFRDAYNFAVAGGTERTIASVPFKHLVQVYQAAQGDAKHAKEILERTGYDKEVKEQSEVIDREFTFVDRWLEKYAPEEIRFEVQQNLPKAELTEKQHTFLTGVADALTTANDLDGQAMHELIYAAKDAADVSPKEAFQALYRVILGKDYGPKAGWFLSSLDRDWLIKRLRLEA